MRDRNSLVSKGVRSPEVRRGRGDGGAIDGEDGRHRRAGVERERTAERELDVERRLHPRLPEGAVRQR